MTKLLHNPGQRAYIFDAKGMFDMTIHGQDVWKYALSHVHDIDAITWVGHAGITTNDANPQLYVSKLYSGHDVGQDVSTADVASFPTENVQPNARIFLGGCDTAATYDEVSKHSLSAGQMTISQAFANHFRTDVQGFAVHIAFGYPVLCVVHENYDVYHDTHFRMADPVTVFPH
jgi:hypothetical protein